MKMRGYLGSLGASASEWTFSAVSTPGYRCPAGTTPDLDNYSNVICRDPSGRVTGGPVALAPAGPGGAPSNYVATGVGTALGWAPVVAAAALIFGLTLFMGKGKR